MGREIKYRARLLNGSKWVYGYYLVKDGRLGPVPMIFEPTGNLDDPEWWHCVDARTVGQFTGRKLPSGEPIYDGDIIDAPHCFGPGGMAVRRFQVHFHVELGYQWNYWDMDEAVIVGNVHENPELLSSRGGECD